MTACSIPFLEVSQEVCSIVYGVLALICLVVLWRVGGYGTP